MSESETSNFGITESDRERIRYLSEKGAPPGDAELRDVLDDDETENDDNGRSDETRSLETRERVLTAPEFERLAIGALRIGDDEQALETWCAVIILGRLGLRGGEFCHISQGWYDDRRKMVSIPAHEPCTSGRDGGPCGDCKQAARQRKKHGDERPVEEIAADYWRPKTKAGVRELPVGWSARVEESVLMLLQLHGGWPYTFSTLQRRLDAAIENAPMLEPGITSLHGLRGSAATYHAGNGVDKEPLKQMMGWTDDQTQKKYLAVNGNMTKRAMNKVYR